METWTDDLAGGILFQDDSYPVHAYNDRVQAQDRFLNLTYRTPNVIKTPERLLRANAAVALARGHPGGPQQLVHHVRASFMFSRNPEFSICSCFFEKKNCPFDKKNMVFCYQNCCDQL